MTNQLKDLLIIGFAAALTLSLGFMGYTYITKDTEGLIKDSKQQDFFKKTAKLKL